MKLGICMAVLALSLEIAASSCLISTASAEPKSLTSEEILACKFKGQRFLVVITPNVDFDGDFTPIQETFANQTVQTLIDKFMLSRLVGEDSRKQQACADYRARDLSKNDIFSVLSGSAATSTNVVQTIHRLSDVIKNIRKNPHHVDAGIQVVIAVASKGPNNKELGKILGKGAVSLHREFADLLYQNLMTKCERENSGCRNPIERMADEVAVFIDDSSQSGFNDQVRSILAAQTGYAQSDMSTESSHATRFLGFTPGVREWRVADYFVNNVSKDLIAAWTGFIDD